MFSPWIPFITSRKPEAIRQLPTYKLAADGWRVVDDDYSQTVRKLQAESMMSTVASLFPQ
jgi:hypothetical protein